MKHSSVISWSDDDSGFRDDSSIAFSEEASSQFSYKTKTWNCFSTSKQRAKTRPGYEEAIPLSKPPRREKFLQRVTRKIFGKNRKKFWKKRDDTEGLESQDKQTNSDHTERQTDDRWEPIDTYTNTREISLLVDNVEPFGRDQLRRTDNWKPRETYTSTQETSFLVDKVEPFRPNQLRCSIRADTNLGSQRARERFRAEEEHAMLRVLFDFDACEENDVSVRRGELVKVLNKDDDDWWWVENVQHLQGFVPKNFLWPCGCYVCEKSILDRVTHGDRNSWGYHHGPEKIRQLARGVSRQRRVNCIDQNGVVETRQLTSTWC